MALIRRQFRQLLFRVFGVSRGHPFACGFATLRSFVAKKYPVVCRT